MRSTVVRHVGRQHLLAPRQLGCHRIGLAIGNCRFGPDAMNEVRQCGVGLRLVEIGVGRKHVNEDLLPAFRGTKRLIVADDIPDLLGGIVRRR